MKARPRATRKTALGQRPRIGSGGSGSSFCSWKNGSDGSGFRFSETGRIGFGEYGFRHQTQFFGPHRVPGRELNKNVTSEVLRRAPDYSSNLCPPKYDLYDFFRGVLGLLSEIRVKITLDGGNGALERKKGLLVETHSEASKTLVLKAFWGASKIARLLKHDY